MEIWLSSFFLVYKNCREISNRTWSLALYWSEQNKVTQNRRTPKIKDKYYRNLLPHSSSLFDCRERRLVLINSKPPSRHQPVWHMAPIFQPRRMLNVHEMCGCRKPSRILVCVRAAGRFFKSVPLNEANYIPEAPIERLMRLNQIYSLNVLF